MKEQAISQTIDKPANKRSLFLVLGIVGLLVLVIASFLGYNAWNQRQQALKAERIAAEQAEALAAIEAKWGIRPYRVNLAADGGLVDLRYQVVDPNKALYIFDDLSNYPKLIVEENGTEVAINNLSHTHDLEFGQTYFVIYRNVADSIQPGELVTISVGDLAIRHFQVEN